MCIYCIFLLALSKTEGYNISTILVVINFRSYSNTKSFFFFMKLPNSRPLFINDYPVNGYAHLYDEAAEIKKER